MINKYLRNATATPVLAAAAIFLCNGLCNGFTNSTRALAAQDANASKAAIQEPSNQIDSYGYAGHPLAVSDTGSLLESSPFVRSAYRPIATEKLASATASGAASATTPTGPEQVLLMPSVRALGFITPNDLETKSLKSLYQLARLTTPAQPHLDVTLFGGGLVSEDYYLTDEGIQLEQSITEGLGIVGRATGYQLWIEKNSTSPLAPSNQTANRLNFGRFQAGFDLSPAPGFNFVFLGGHDVGDSDAWTVESDISMWFLLSSDHPVNVFIAPVHNFQNDVTSSEIDFRIVAMRTPDWILMLGAGGQVFGGGFIDGLAGEGGPIVGIYNRLYQLGADLQFGYGSPGFYGELTLYKTFSIPGL